MKRIIVRLLRRKKDPVILRNGLDKMKIIPTTGKAFQVLLTLSNGTRRFTDFTAITEDGFTIEDFVFAMTTQQEGSNWEIDFNEELTA